MTATAPDAQTWEWTGAVAPDDALAIAEFVGPAAKAAARDGRLPLFACARPVNELLVGAPWSTWFDMQSAGHVVHLAQRVERHTDSPLGEEISAHGHVESQGWFGSIYALDIGIELRARSDGRLRARCRGRYGVTGLTPDGTPSRRPDPASAAGSAVVAFERELRFGAGVGAAFAARIADPNPIHLSDGAARAAGFDGTIVHGFLTLAGAVDLVVQERCAGDERRLSSVVASFKAPVPCGGSMVVQGLLARDDHTRCHVRARTRGRSVLRNAVVELAR